MSDLPCYFRQEGEGGGGVNGELIKSELLLCKLEGHAKILIMSLDSLKPQLNPGPPKGGFSEPPKGFLQYVSNKKGHQNEIFADCQ